MELTLSEKALSEEKNLDSFITKMCLIGFNSEMNTAKIKPPKGMAAYTCKCFKEKITLGYSLDSAQKECKMKAAKNFDLKKNSHD